MTEIQLIMTISTTTTTSTAAVTTYFSFCLADINSRLGQVPKGELLQLLKHVFTVYCFLKFPEYLSLLPN